MAIKFGPALKLAVSVVLITIVLVRVDLRAVSRTIAEADEVPLILAVLLSIAMTVADAAQWQSVLRALGHRISSGAALLYGFSGTFFGMIGPSSIGVDIFRAAQMRSLGISTETAVRSVLAARLLAFVSLLIVIATGLPIAFSYKLGFRNQFLLGSTFAAGACALAALLSFQPLRQRISMLRRSTALAKLADVSKDLGTVLTSKTQSLASLFYATATHVLRLSIFAALAWAFHAGVGFWPLYALIPTALLVAMVPITIASWGVRELSVIFFLGWVGVAPAAALSISVAFGVLRLVVAGIGGIVWVLASSRHYGLQIANKLD